MVTHNLVQSGIRRLPNARAARPAPLNNSLALEVLGTARCLQLRPQIEAFESHVFGPDFAVGNAEMDNWTKSGSWCCAAVVGQAVVGRQQVFSILSLLVTTAASRDALLAGEISEAELQPWTQSPPSEKPVLYLASVISAAREHLASLYESLASDLLQFRDAWDADFASGFSIASGPAGLSHMARNGFRVIDGPQYRDRYPIMLIDRQSAETEFWQDVFSDVRHPGYEEHGVETAISPLFSSVALAS